MTGVGISWVWGGGDSVRCTVGVTVGPRPACAGCPLAGGILAFAGPGAALADASVLFLGVLGGRDDPWTWHGFFHPGLRHALHSLHRLVRDDAAGAGRGARVEAPALDRLRSSSLSCGAGRGRDEGAGLQGWTAGLRGVPGCSGRHRRSSGQGSRQRGYWHAIVVVGPVFDALRPSLAAPLHSAGSEGDPSAP